MSDTGYGAPRRREPSEDSGEDIDERFPVKKPGETPGEVDDDGETADLDAAEVMPGNESGTESEPEPDDRINNNATRVNEMAYTPGDYAEGNEVAQTMEPSASSDGAMGKAEFEAKQDDEDVGVSDPGDFDWAAFIESFGFWQARSYASRTQLITALNVSPQCGVAADAMLEAATEQGYLTEQQPVAGGYRYYPGAEVEING